MGSILIVYLTLLVMYFVDFFSPVFAVQVFKSFFVLSIQWPNLKNLSGGLNLSRVLNIGWFHLKLYQMFQDLNRRLI